MDFAGFREVYEDLIAQDPRRVAVARRHAGRDDDAHEPGRDRHRRLRAAPDAGPGLHRRHRRDRAAAGPARHGEVAARGARRVEGHDDDLDLRPPRDPGRGVGRVPGPDRGAAPGRATASTSRSSGASGWRRPAAPVRRAAWRARRRGRRAPSGGDALPRPGGHLAGEGAPHARPPGGAARPARLGADRRPGARAGDRRPHAGGDGADPGAHPADPGPGRDARRGAAAPARDVLRHDRLRDRAHLRPPAARVAAATDRVGQVPPPAVARGEEAGPQPPDRRRGARDLHPPRVPGREELLDRGPRRADPDARRDVRPGRATRACARSSWAWRTAAG